MLHEFSLPLYFMAYSYFDLQKVSKCPKSLETKYVKVLPVVMNLNRVKLSSYPEY